MDRLGVVHRGDRVAGRPRYRRHRQPRGRLQPQPEPQHRSELPRLLPAAGVHTDSVGGHLHAEDLHQLPDHRCHHPNLDLGTAATVLLTAIGAAISAALLAVPFIGPLLAIVAALITAAFGLAQVTGLLGQIVSLFVSGLTFNVYKQPQNFQVLAASSPFDPAVDVTLVAVAAGVQASDKNELVLSVDI